MNGPRLCMNCLQPNHPERVELGLTMCVVCAELHPSPRPRALTTCVNQSGDTEIHILPNSAIPRLVELNYLPQQNDLPHQLPE